MSGSKPVLICLLCILMGCADNSTSHQYIHKDADTVLQIMIEPAFDAHAMIMLDLRRNFYYFDIGEDPSPFNIGYTHFLDTIKPEYKYTLQPFLNDSMINALRPYNDSGQYFDGLGLRILLCYDGKRDTVLSQNVYPDQLKTLLKQHLYIVSRNADQRKIRVYCMLLFHDWRQFYPIDFL